MKTSPTLVDRCEDVFEKILDGTITVTMIAQVFSNLKVKGRNYNDIKTALLNAGDQEHNIETDIYTRQNIMSNFNWQDRALRDNLKKWGLPNGLKTYKKSIIHEHATKAGWTYDSSYGAWRKPTASKK